MGGAARGKGAGAASAASARGASATRSARNKLPSRAGGYGTAGRTG